MEYITEVDIGTPYLVISSKGYWNSSITEFDIGIPGHWLYRVIEIMVPSFTEFDIGIPHLEIGIPRLGLSLV